MSAPGVLALWNDVAPDDEAEFNRWYLHEHLPERVGVPGFLRGRRYVAITGEPKYFAFYETVEVGVLTSPAYLERLDNPTPWTRRVMPLFRNMHRSVCRVVSSLARGQGGTVATLRIDAAPEHAATLRTWLAKTAIPALAEQPGIVAAHLWEADLSATRGQSEERKLRGGADQSPGWAVLVEATVPEEVTAACRTLLAPEQLQAHGAEGPAALGVYRLFHALSIDAGPAPEAGAGRA